ncbi:cytochrome b [Psittacicella hinzii]|uniref:Cytochrome b561 bacterial/Ni-hydrogenase domain-containing protein n=1 Tax=Psittacicella hinzii TaxID=2028575 RepID=A0A3A1YJY7_9GAMM|nr:cytochrome b [Psittacicella hinzii]RIY37549.1 hypothetical protein CKF58_04750 [Psittacicella hinzii]
MTTLQKSTKYPLISIALHWFILVAVVGAYVCVWAKLYNPWHFFFGALALVLSVVRFVTMHALAKRKPAIIPPISPLQNLAALVIKIVLALGFIILPLQGLLGRAFYGRATDFWRVEIFPAFDVNPEIASKLLQGHVVFAYVLLGAIGLHAAAALFHHFVRKDNTLKRMM